ncbi:HEAT repeat domain-containing protein [Streptomyces termitum]|uniref:HEAT repeat domain-containing protein n=1 Tax=Streptomyces termitum TaxID=67368 RepID=UPI0016785982|nr:HEAT repeat domain-containing protein [Streptomyces termitum]
MSPTSPPPRIPRPSGVPASSEAALALAAEPPEGWRGWPAGVLVPSVRVALLRAEIAHRPEALADEERTQTLYQAVRAIRATDAPAGLPALVRLLAGGADPVLEAEALRLVREGVRTAALRPAPAREVLAGLLESPADTVVRDALTELAEPWARVDPLPADRPARLVRPGTAGPALTVLAAHGHAGPLRRAAGDPEAEPGTRRRALALLGGLAHRDDVPALLALAGRDPLLLAGPALDCLRAMHRRGHFATDADVPAVLALALADHTVPARTVATVLFTSRHALLDLLADAPPDDPHRRRRLDLLVALDGQGTGGLPVAARIARALPAATDPAPSLRALRTLADPATEDAVLAALPTAPAAALDALEAVGGERTVRVLAAALGLAPALGPDPEAEEAEEGVARALRGFQGRALELLWLLAGDAGTRHRILDRIDTGRLPHRILADLGGPDEREAVLLAAHLDPADPVDALCRLAAHGGPGVLPVLSDLLLRIAGELAAAWDGAGAEPVPDGEPAVPAAVVDAVRSLGERLRGRGRIRPVHLLDAPVTGAGAALLTGMVLDLLDRPDLATGERRVLLRLLLDLPDAPHRRIAARVHRLLRHPDRHVRKQAVALLARGPEGDEGVGAVSASLLALTGPDRDPQTVRQTLDALGGARARWAAEAVASCLDHPVMNVRKTAARALATAGTAAAVPPLLHHLGRTDNPGLRGLLLDALGAILGDTRTAAVTAAAERAADARVRARLSAATAPDPAPDADGADLRHLAERGWDPERALRLAARAAAPGTATVGWAPVLRPYLSDWLLLAAGPAPARRTVLAALPTAVCPGPWQPHERGTLARHAGVLLDGLAEAGPEERDGLLALLEAAAPHLAPEAAAKAVAAVRALPPRRPGRRSALPLLRLAGAVVVRADLDRELAATDLADDPPTARARLLRETFGLGRPAAEHPPWYGELAAAVREPADLAALRARGVAAGSRALLTALAAVQADAPPAVRAALVDWMTELQPLGAPEWTLGEPPAPRPGHRAGAPRSAALRAATLALLASDDAGRRNAAARTLLGWPEPDTRAALLDAYLRGRVELPDTAGLQEDAARLLAAADPAALLADAAGAVRAAGLAARFDPGPLVPLAPLLLALWEHGPREARPQAFTALCRTPADALAALLEPRLAAGATGLLAPLAGRPLLRTPLLDRLARRHPEAGLLLVDGPLRDPGTAGRDAAALRALRERAPAAGPSAAPAAEDPAVLLRSPDPRRVRRGLARLVEDTAPGTDGLAGLLEGLLSHRDTGVRLHAHRASRALLDRDAHLRLTERLLGDPNPDVVRGAVRTLAGARRASAAPALVALLGHGREPVRRSAGEALLRLGPAAVPALRRAASRARPDRRPVYEELLAGIGDDGTDGTAPE